jgi:hypothetical protein
MAAKEALIRSVVQTIPTYTMGVFKLPAYICEDLTQIIRKFWWGEEGTLDHLGSAACTKV